VRRVLTGREFTPALRWWALGAMALGLLSINLDFTVLNVALGDMQRDLETSVSDLQWVINAYTLTLAPGVVIAGRLGDIYGRRRLFLGGTALFAVAAAGGALAPDVWFLAGARAAQGVGAAALYALSLAIISDVFPERERGRALGIWAGVAATAIAGGPLVGGIVVDALGWRYVFVLLLPFAIGCIALTAVSVPESRDEETPRVTDMAGVLLAAFGLTALVFVFIESRAWGWLSLRTGVLAVLAVVTLTAFVAVERRRFAPLVDLGLFRNARFVGANTTSFALPFVVWAMLFFQPLYFQRIRGDSPLIAGVALLPATVAWGGLSLFAGRLIGAFGTRRLMASGMALLALGMALQGLGTRSR
jgi:EmrB/QacA subfamily drug resistance transporter